MEIIDPALQSYIEAHCPPEPELLQKINRETYLKMLKPHMISGHYQGRLLSMLSKIAQPKYILEIGTYTGYATLCLAEGLVENGEIHTIEVDAEKEEMIRKNFSLSAYSKNIFPHFGDAQHLILELSVESFDIAFIDADKKSNFLYYQLVIDRIKQGGLIIVDNVLWKGKVYNEAVNDSDTSTIREFNDMASSDPRVESLILPVRDGILVVRKI
jgi:caffeoyl-CoA O-methyltransferase